MPVCNDFRGRKGCGQQVRWDFSEAEKKNVMFNLDGTIHNLSSPEHYMTSAVRSSSGQQETQANTNVERILNVIIPQIEAANLKLREEIKSDKLTETSIDNLAINSIQTEIKNISTNVREIREAQNISTKDSKQTLGDKIDILLTGQKAIEEGFTAFTGYTEALLMKQGFPSAAEVLKQKEEQLKIASN